MLDTTSPRAERPLTLAQPTGAPKAGAPPAPQACGPPAPTSTSVGPPRTPAPRPHTSAPKEVPGHPLVRPGPRHPLPPHPPFGGHSTRSPAPAGLSPAAPARTLSDSAPPRYSSCPWCPSASQRRLKPTLGHPAAAPQSLGLLFLTLQVQGGGRRVPRADPGARLAVSQPWPGGGRRGGEGLPPVGWDSPAAVAARGRAPNAARVPARRVAERAGHRAPAPRLRPRGGREPASWPGALEQSSPERRGQDKLSTENRGG